MSKFLRTRLPRHYSFFLFIPCLISSQRVLGLNFSNKSTFMKLCACLRCASYTRKNQNAHRPTSNVHSTCNTKRIIHKCWHSQSISFFHVSWLVQILHCVWKLILNFRKLHNFCYVVSLRNTITVPDVMQFYFVFTIEIILFEFLFIICLY